MMALKASMVGLILLLGAYVASLWRRRRTETRSSAPSSRWRLSSSPKMVSVIRGGAPAVKRIRKRKAE
jgi:hypothetical protein